jgi:RHS repeat-associated protein
MSKAGKIQYKDTDLNYLNARYYDSERGQFLSQDSVFWKLPKELLSDPQQLNSYSYARNNPIRMKDPSGMLSVTGKIQKGDTLSKVTQQLNERFKLDLNISQVARANGIQNINNIKEGNRIILPKTNLELRFDNKHLQAFDKNYGVGFNDLKWSGMSGSAKREFDPIAEGNWKTVDPSEIQYWKDISFANKVGSTLGGLVSSIGKIGRFPGGTYSWGTQRTELHSMDGGPQSGFYIHGGSPSSPDSAGCIDLNSSNNSFHDFFRSYGRSLDVVVSY